VQALAYPENASDPYLTDWIKHPKNPVITEVPPNGTSFQFRDPQTAWRQDGMWLTTIGAQVACLGSAPLYASEDFLEWAFYGFFHSQVQLQFRNTMTVSKTLIFST
jgi:beta-fructofuranosidase